MLGDLLALLMICGWVYWLFAWWTTRVFFQQGRAESHPFRDYCPPVSVLKPVRGVDPAAHENFETFFRQDYPDYEVLFGVADPDDPVVPLIRRLLKQYPERRARLVFGKAFGPNEKACLLHLLARAASHHILVASDSDMRVSPDYLRRVVAPLADPGTGLVTCPYVAEEALSLPAGLEALHMGVSFLPSVLVGRKVLSGRFAMGASLAIRREDLERAGGFGALNEYLAEDYQIGVRVSELGLRVHFSSYVIGSVLGATTFEEEMAREVRWARCTRASRPKEYPGYFLTMTTAFAAALALASSLASPQREALVVTVLLRWLVAWKISGYTGDHESRRWLLLLPVRDLLTALVWVTGGLGRRVAWRGDRYELLEGGRMRLVARAEGEEEEEEEPGAARAGAQGPGQRP